MYRKVYLLIMVILPLCQPQQGQSQVIVSIPPQKQFVNQIAGNKISVDVILTPGQSPETFSPTPRQLTVLSDASVFFQIGVPFEVHWTDSLEAINPDMKVVECCQQFAGLLNNFSQDDMHYWTDPVFIQYYLVMVLETLTELQPENKDFFDSNFNDYLNSIRQLDAFIINKLQNRKINEFIISHAALGAYSDRYGLAQLSLEQNGREPGPKKLLNIIESARQLNIKTLFVIEQYHTRTVNNLARQLGAKIEAIDPLADDYLGNMYEITEKISQSLGVKP